MSELTMSRVWQDGRFFTTMRTTDGRRVSIVYRGVWTYSDGPDFRDAMIEIDGRLTRGSVELHVRSSDWDAHGHTADGGYDDVILHVVLDDDRDGPVVTKAGAVVPTVTLPLFLSEPFEQVEREVFASTLGDVGIRPCLPTVSLNQPEQVRSALRQQGWMRLVAKQLRFQQDLERMSPGEVLYRGLLDGLGLSSNRLGMAEVANRLPLALIEAHAVDREQTLALLFTAGGFFPVTPAHASLADLSPAEIEQVERVAARLDQGVVAGRGPVPGWNLNRVRPANHPVRRLASLADLLHRSRDGGLLSTVLAVRLDRTTSWREWLESARPAIGRARADQIVTNVLAPFTAAYADITGNRELGEAVSALWEQLPGAADDSIARATLRQIVGDARFPIGLALENQGLHQIGRNGCRQLRCFECPIAALAVRFEPTEHGLREEA